VLPVPATAENHLFDDWDQVWADAPRACAAAGPLCARLRRWLQPVWGLRLPPADYTHNDLNLSNILTDGHGSLAWSTGMSSGWAAARWT
jgi:aminoglycoside phosphotransferase (APT) family kinase protein